MVVSFRVARVREEEFHPITRSSVPPHGRCQVYIADGSERERERERERDRCDFFPSFHLALDRYRDVACCALFPFSFLTESPSMPLRGSIP